MVKLSSEYLNELRGYVNILEIRAEAMKKADVELYTFAFSASVDADKHTEHNRVLACVKSIERLYGALGFDTDNRVEAGRFACRALGKEELQGLVD